MKNQKGFTLMEMLIVVAIIAVLVAIAIPALSGSLEKSRQAVDMANARSLEALLAAMIQTGEIEFPQEVTDKTVGVWVLVVRDKNHLPISYSSGNFASDSNVYCGTDPGVTVNGVSTAGWGPQNSELAKAIGSMTGISSKSRDGKSGWDWYIVQYKYEADTQSLYSYIYSGMKGAESALDKATGDMTNIALAMARRKNKP